MPRKCANATCKKVAILKRPKTEPMVLSGESRLRSPYVQYPKENLEKAIKAVREENMSCMRASKTFAVPRSTLKNYLDERSRLGVRIGRPKSIPDDVENDLVDQAIAAAEAGFPVTKKEFLLKIELTAKKLKLNTAFRDGSPGNDYWRSLKRRRPDLVGNIRKCDNQNINMKKNLESDIVTKYFDQLEKLISDLDLLMKPASIWNAGEVGVQYCSEPMKLIPKRGTQSTASKPVINRELMNAVLCINAIGNAMPPMFDVVRNDVRTFQKFSQQSTTDANATVWTVEEDFLKSDEVMLLWFREFFLKNCGTERPQLLIMDNHGSQEMLELLDLARKNSVHILSLPPRTSPWLDPLDRGIFMMFQKCCRRVALQFMLDNPALIIDHSTWPNIVCTVWEEVMTSEVIMGAFSITGTYPLDRSKIGKNALKAINSAHSEMKTETVGLAPTACTNTTSTSSHLNVSSTIVQTTPASTNHYGTGSMANPHPPQFQSQPHINFTHLTHHHSGATVIVSTPSKNHIMTTPLAKSTINISNNSSNNHNVQTAAPSVPGTGEDLGQAQIYSTQVSNPDFITSTDPSSMFPGFNT